ncbi:MAG: aldo/keto reductase [Ectothiorhodospiraceae bacterium]|jgi:predicted oxidoreductase
MNLSTARLPGLYPARSGTETHVPRLLLGLWRVGDWGLSANELAQRLERAMELGLDTLDLADIYGDYRAERIAGEALARVPAVRERFRIVSKCGIALTSAHRPDHRVKHYDTTREHILKSVDRSLGDLGVEHLDTLLIHRPDPLMDPDEVAETFANLRQAGKVRRFGVSNFTPPQFRMLASRVEQPLVTNQIELSLLNPAALFDGTLDQCLTERVTPTIWSPLGGGGLFRDKDARALRVRGALEAVARQVGAEGIDQVALAWVLAHPSRPGVVIGSGKPERWARAQRALELALDRQQWFELLEASRGHEVA